jgi:MFS family permease
MAELSDLWWLGMLLAAFAGGAFGAAIGALPAFIFTGFLVMLGESIRILSGDLSGLMGVDPDTLQSATITGQIAFGPVFGPHISFAAGAAASAYAAKKGYMNTGFPYHESKNIGFAFGPKPDVLLVGGLFGILGYWITALSSAFSMPWDPIAVAVVLSAFAHRLFFKYPLMGKAPKGRLNMNPFERQEKKGKDSERLLVEPWLGHQYKWLDVTMLGFVVGVLAAFITYQTGSAFLPFGISAASLFFLNLGVQRIPVTHHMSLIASTAILAASGSDFSGFDMGALLMIGAVFGVIAALFGELTQRLFYAHADTHLDPPAFAIVLGTFLIVIFYLIDIFESSAWVPVPF